MPVDQPRDGGTERLLLVAPNPNQEPIRALNARRQRRADARSRTDPHAALVQSRRVRDPCEFKLASPERCGRVVDEAAGEVALDSTDEVVVLCVCAF